MKKDIEKLILKYKRQIELIEDKIKHAPFSPYWVHNKSESKTLQNSINDLTQVLKNSENTTSVSDTIGESGVLHDVGESHASGQTDNDSLASGELPLEKITEAKEVCQNCGKPIKVYPRRGQWHHCKCGFITKVN